MLPDGIVDAIDFNIWNDHTFQSCTGWAAADFNGDGVDECPLNAVCLTLGIVGKSRAITGAGQAEE